MADQYDKILSHAIVSGHFVVKALHKHANLYIDKERFSETGATDMVQLIEGAGENALQQGLILPDLSDAPEIGVIAPAYGALMYPLVLAAYLEKMTGRKFFPARTEAFPDPTNPDKLIHRVPKKRLAYYRGKYYILFDDIVNNGTTYHEVKPLFESEEVDGHVFAGICVYDRGNQTAESLNVGQYFPFRRGFMKQHDLKLEPCPDCQKGIPIDTVLGKGKAWVNMFGQPPYPPDMDFSAFWADKK
jgi:hypothetical protein